MKTIQLVVRVEVPDKTSPKRVQKLTEMLLDIGLNDAAETLEMESDGGPPSQNIRDAKAVTDWNFHAPEFMCEACGRPAAKLASVALGTTFVDADPIVDEGELPRRRIPPRDRCGE